MRHLLNWHVDRLTSPRYFWTTGIITGLALAAAIWAIASALTRI